MSKQALVVGATGQIGLAVVKSLVGHGWQVTAVHRGQTEAPAGWEESGVRRVTADREEPGALRSALGGGADLVVDTVAYDDAHARQLIELADDVGTFVVISSAAVYADDEGRGLDGSGVFPVFDGPVSETHRTVSPGPEGYATKKMLLERTLLDSSPTPATLLRAGAIHGPGSSSPRELWPLLRALERRPAIPIAHGDTIFHATSVDNLAELVRCSAERTGSRALNAGDPNPPTAREAVQLVCDTVGHRPALVLLPGDAPTEGTTAHAGATPWSLPHSFVLDMTAASRETGYQPVASYANAVVDTVRWLREVLAERPWAEALPKMAEFYGDRLTNFAAEDALLADLAGVRAAAG